MRYYSVGIDNTYNNLRIIKWLWPTYTLFQIPRETGRERERIATASNVLIVIFHWMECAVAALKIYKLIKTAANILIVLSLTKRTTAKKRVGGRIEKATTSLTRVRLPYEWELTPKILAQISHYRSQILSLSVITETLWRVLRCYNFASAAGAAAAAQTFMNNFYSHPPFVHIIFVRVSNLIVTLCSKTWRACWKRFFI